MIEIKSQSSHEFSRLATQPRYTYLFLYYHKTRLFKQYRVGPYSCVSNTVETYARNQKQSKSCRQRLRLNQFSFKLIQCDFVKEVWKIRCKSNGEGLYVFEPIILSSLFVKNNCLQSSSFDWTENIETTTSVEIMACTSHLENHQTSLMIGRPSFSRTIVRLMILTLHINRKKKTNANIVPHVLQHVFR